MRLLRRALIVTTAGLVALLGQQTSAYAGTDKVSEVTGSYAKFISSGDKFHVCDTSWDGWNAYVDFEYVRIDGSLQTGQHLVTGGAGECGTWDHNFGEGRIVNFRACVEILVYPDICDVWKAGVA